MAKFVPAYDTRTGKKLPHFVPEHHIDHPVIGRFLSRTPRAKASGRKAAEAATNEAPATGDDKKE
ncbi:hypothetical protein ACQP60_18950 [Isoptericola variabilis]|uniref:hypothetical protein n=1 Tax=Isoptericola variabilis TaxID=139208 RepID=UPI003D1C2979